VNLPPNQAFHAPNIKIKKFGAIHTIWSRFELILGENLTVLILTNRIVLLLLFNPFLNKKYRDY